VLIVSVIENPRASNAKGSKADPNVAVALIPVDALIAPNVASDRLMFQLFCSSSPDLVAPHAVSTARVAVYEHAMFLCVFCFRS